MAEAEQGSTQFGPRLLALGVDPPSAELVSQVTTSVEEALQLLGRDPDRQSSPALGKWREYFCARAQRLYYCNDDIAYNSWEAPPCFKFGEWRLDAELYGTSLRLARDIYTVLDALLTRHPPALVYPALGLLARVMGNVVDCGNTVEKYRCLKTSNPKFREAVWDVSGASQVLFLTGWQQQGGLVTLPEGAPLGPLLAASARLHRLAERRGHSGAATRVDPEAEEAAGRPKSDFYGKPGFMYQEQIMHCSLCDHPINDGSERLWTGRHDAPQGEYRYRCTTCQGAGSAFDLCQGCWEGFQAASQPGGASTSSGGGGSTSGGGSSGGGSSGSRHGRAQHDPTHAFQHVGPRMSRHNNYYATNGGGQGGGGRGSPWGGGGGGGGSYSRALQRMGERYGIHHFA